MTMMIRPTVSVWGESSSRFVEEPDLFDELMTFLGIQSSSERLFESRNDGIEYCFEDTDKFLAYLEGMDIPKVLDLFSQFHGEEPDIRSTSHISPEEQENLLSLLHNFKVLAPTWRTWMGKMGQDLQGVFTLFSD